MISFLATVPFAQWESDGRILSVKDLLRTQVAISPLFGSVTPSEKQALALWNGVTIHDLRMPTGDGRWFRFDAKSSTTVRVRGVPVFVGRFINRVEFP